MKRRPVYFGSIGACLGVIVPSELIAFIAEDLMTNGAWRYLQLRIRNVFSGELCVFFRGVVRSPAPTIT